jgi:hypothetical protein
VDPAEGRRDAQPSRRLWIAVVGVLMGLGAIVAVPFALSSERKADPETAPDQLPTELDVPQSGFVPDPVVAVPPAAPPAATMPTGHAATPVPPPFKPLTIEAESGVVTGSAWKWDGYPAASGGWIVRNLGNWGGAPGILTLNGIVFPNTASYTFAISFVHPNGEQTRSAQVTVSGVPAKTVNFTASGSDCCATQAVTMKVPAGSHSITIENPTGHAPSIDRIVITRTGS